MPADDEHGRSLSRQTTTQQQAQQQQLQLQQQQQQIQNGGSNTNLTTPSVQCTCTDCLSAPGADHHHHHHHHNHHHHHHHHHSHRYTGSEKNLLEAERYTPVGFVSERSQSDRLPSGERYQAVSERYPLGERPQTSISSERLLCKELGGHCAGLERYYAAQRYTPDRYTPVGSLDRYGVYSRTSTPDRYVEKERYSPKYDYSRGTKVKRFDYAGFAPIPCPERFAESFQYLEPPSPAPSSDRFIPPPPLSPSSPPDCFPNNAFPSPTAPSLPSTTDRFIPPPPLSPSPTDTYPTAIAPASSTAYTASPKSGKLRYDPRYPANEPRYHTVDQQRLKTGYYDRAEKYLDRYSSANNTAGVAGAGAGHIPPNAHVPVERYVPQPTDYYNTYDRYKITAVANNTSNPGDPYMRRDLYYRLPVPYAQYAQQQQQQQQQQRMRYMGTPSRIKCCYADNYQLSKSSPGSSSSNSSVTSQKECHESAQCQNYQQQEKSTQCSASVASSGGGGYVISPPTNLSRGAKMHNGGGGPPQCRHSICASPSVEYVGASGGRHVCATPPPPRGSIGSGDGSLCSDSCCSRRSQSSLSNTVWRTQPATSQQTQQTVPQQSQQQQQQQPADAQPPCLAPTAHNQRSATPTTNNDTSLSNNSTSSATDDKTLSETSDMKSSPSPPLIRGANYAAPPTSGPSSASSARAVSLPAGPPTNTSTWPAGPTPNAPRINYSQSERLPRQRPPLNRSQSRKEMIKNYIKRETANFFGVDEENEDEQQLRWLDRRKRMAARTMGPLKEEYQTLSGRSHRRTISDVGPSNALRSGGRPDVLPGPSDDIVDSQDAPGEVTIRRKDSVARMTWDGLSYVVTTLTRHRPRPRSQQSQWSRSFAPETLPPSPPSASEAEEQTFFERPALPAAPTEGDEAAAEVVPDAVDRTVDVHDVQPAYRGVMERYSNRAPSGGWRRDYHRPEVVLRRDDGRPPVGGTRIYPSTLDHVLDNSDRRQYGMGWVGKVFNRSLRKSVAQDARVMEQLDDMEDHRPMFTYWVTIVQILVLCISIMCYKIGPFGVDLSSRSGQVLVTSLSLQQIDYTEPANFWFGPRAADLIHLGAKFAPCMRVDDKISQQIEKIRSKERETACCIRNDDSGCVQSSQADCSYKFSSKSNKMRGLRPTKTISTWKKWKPDDAGPGGRISGSVCGLDPKFCDSPSYDWPDDITKWPICRKKTGFSIQKRSRNKLADHMVCEVIGHPCCIGIHGQCKITTREYCDFVRGTFHEEASLCSQVSCLNDICGMLPFYFPDIPDQFYRLWTSLFLHAGVLQLIITVLIQYFLMRDLEKLTGSLRIAIIYLGSGMAGNLASAIFVPYRADVGPAGSQFGLLACLIVEVLNAWPMLKHPNQALFKLLAITLFLFLLGLMPWVDNYAHLFGFIFGFLLSYALLPFISFGRYDRHKKIFLIWVCLAAAVVLFICLVLLFYVIPVYDCRVCSYFNCIPLTRDFCASQNINFKREEPVV